jgi:3-isopropylmalate/(R)-2-methylmalate dehydratase small subunit
MTEAVELQIRGRVFKFGDNINSDVIIPARHLIYIDAERLGQHAFEVLGADFPAKLCDYQILVAGRNFGCGSAREQAATAILGLGIRCVVACSFARTFYRNAINDGLPIVECPAVYPAIETGDELEIDFAGGALRHRAHSYPFPALPESVRGILECGGLANYLKAQLEKQPPR